MLKVEFRAMGCQMAALVDRETSAAAGALQQVPVWFETWEQALSRFRADSDLNRLNAGAGEWVSVEPVLYEVVQAALQAAQWSSGLVVPTVRDALEQAGYDRSFELIRPGEDVAVLPAARVGLSRWPEIQLDARRCAVYLPGSARLDLGGIAKGWAAHQAAQRLAQFGPSLVDAGGDIAISGADSDGDPWPVSIADPVKPEEDLGVLLLYGGGVATSGIDYRRWLRGGTWMHHLIDPRSGRPADTDILSVTVAAPDVMLAETAAKTALILGSQAGMGWVEQHLNLHALFALQDGSLRFSSGIGELFWREYVR